MISKTLLKMVIFIVTAICSFSELYADEFPGLILTPELVESVTTNHGSLNLCDSKSPYLEVLEDKDGKLTYDEIKKIKSPPFKICTNLPANERNHGKTYWFRFKVENKSNLLIDWILEIPYPLLDEIEVYSDPKEALNHKTYPIKSGDKFVNFLDGRDFKYKNFTYNVTIKSESETYFYIKVKTDGGVIVPIHLWTHKNFIHNINGINYFQGIYIGIIIAMIFYNFLIYISIRESIYIYYIFSIFSFLIWMGSINGLIFEWIFPYSPNFANNLPILSVPIYVVFAGQFARKFLFHDERIQEYNKYLYASFVLLLAIPAYPFVEYYLLHQIEIVITILFCFFLFFIASISYFQFKYKPALYYLVAGTPLIFIMVLNRLKVWWGLLDDWAIASNNALLVASVWEAIFLSYALRERITQLRIDKEKIQEELINSYARFVPKQLLAMLGKDIITKIGLGDSIQKNMTILFSDIRSFTTISETLSPEENFGLINSYLEMMGPCIRKYNGYIDKYIGDGIMALFPEKASDAIDAAIEMLEELHKLNKKRAERGFSRLSIGIGIHTGTQMLGIIGEKERMEGTVISDVVNTASRLESLTKNYASALLISEDVFNKIDKNKYDFRYLDTVKVKGKNHAVKIIEILNGVSDRIHNLKLSTREDFEEGIKLYTERQFEKSIAMFNSVLERDPRDKAASLYIQRCNFYLNSGTDLSWDGIERLDFK